MVATATVNKTRVLHLYCPSLSSLRNKKKKIMNMSPLGSLILGLTLWEMGVGLVDAEFTIGASRVKNGA